MSEKVLFIHVDIDSPETLLRFWGKPPGPSGGAALDAFYGTAMMRALALFKECGVPATFFCVGSEIERSKVAASLIGQAAGTGHEIANHSFTHPYGLKDFDSESRIREIQKTSDAIAAVTGQKPVGFRSPSFSINAELLESLESLSFEYDSSVFYSTLGPLMKFYHSLSSRSAAPSGYEGGLRACPRHPYFPDRKDFLKSGATRKILEIPMPRTALGLPFYHNFHLMTGSWYRRAAVSRFQRDAAPYLFHLIEFCDLSDEGVPTALSVHPNVNLRVKDKLEGIKNTISLFKKRYRIMRTDEFVREYKRTRGKDLS